MTLIEKVIRIDQGLIFYFQPDIVFYTL